MFILKVIGEILLFVLSLGYNILNLIILLIDGFVLFAMLPITIRENKESGNVLDDIKWEIGILALSVGILSVTLFINIHFSKDYETIKTELPNIVSYEGIANVKEGKYNYDYMYFSQHTNNGDVIVKLKPNKVRIYYTEDKNIKIIKKDKIYNHIFKYIIFDSFNDNTAYDVYLPKEDEED